MKDLVLNRTLVLYRWLPFVLYFPIIVYSSLCFGTLGLVGSVSNTKLLGSGRQIDLEEGRSLCEHAGWETEDGYKFLDDWISLEKEHPVIPSFDDFPREIVAPKNRGFSIVLISFMEGTCFVSLLFPKKMGPDWQQAIGHIGHGGCQEHLICPSPGRIYGFMDDLY